MEKRRGAGGLWVRFTLARLGLFAAVLVVLLLVLPVEPWVSTVLAAVIAFCLSVILLSGPRSQLSQQLHEQRRRPPARDRDGETEDAALDSPEFRI